jgi:hypothetical protein
MKYSIQILFYISTRGTVCSQPNRLRASTIEPAAAAVYRQVYCAEASIGDLLQDEHLLVSHLGSGTHFHGAPCSWHVRHAGLGDVED